MFVVVFCRWCLTNHLPRLNAIRRCHRSSPLPRRLCLCCCCRCSCCHCHLFLFSSSFNFLVTRRNHVCVFVYLLKNVVAISNGWCYIYFFYLLSSLLLFVARYLFTAHLETVLDCALNKWRTKLTLPLSRFGYAMLFIYLLILPFFFSSLIFNSLLSISAIRFAFCSFGAFVLAWSTTHHLCDNIWWRNLHMTVTVDILRCSK